MTHETILPERKAAILAKLLPSYNMTVSAVAQTEGISEATLYNWRNQAKSEGKPVPGADKNSEQWPAEARFAAIVETATLSEAEVVMSTSPKMEQLYLPADTFEFLNKSDHLLKYRLFLCFVLRV